MASRGHRNKGGRTTPKGTRPANWQKGARSAIEMEPEEPDLFSDVRRQLASRRPLDFLAEVSGILAVVDPRSRNPFERASAKDDSHVTLDELIRTFADVECTETTALLAGIGELAPDEMLRAKGRSAVAARRHRIPGWLADLGRSEAYRCMEMVHVLGDGDDVIVGLRLPDRSELTIVVYIDHNLGGLVKDAFVLAERIDAVVATMKKRNPDFADTEWRDLDPADARSRITDAVHLAAITFPPLESDTWPACRPLVEWTCRLLPEGGSGYSRPEWDENALAALTESFFDSPFAEGLDSADRRSLFESILWFGTDYGPGDPLRWSPVAVEIILTDWIPRKIVAPSEFLEAAPALLRALIRYSHHERGIRAGLTEETLEAVDMFEAEYLEAIHSDRPQGPAALLAAMDAFNARGSRNDDFDDDDFDDEIAGFDYRRAWRHSLVATLGSEAALGALDDAALPDEALRYDGIPNDIVSRVEEVAALVDRCCDELLDIEYRTACRRLLARIASGDPDIFRRKSRSDITAVTICWIIGRTNNLFTPPRAVLTAKALFEHFGLTKPKVSTRALTLSLGAGIDIAHDFNLAGGYLVGVPEMLVSSRRRHLIKLRDVDWS